MKFGEALNAQLTSEWRSQYFRYDEAKQMLTNFKENLPQLDEANPQDLEGLINLFEIRFFEFAEKELKKINIFFLEKLNEAKRKLAKLNSDLDDYQRFQHHKGFQKTGEPSVVSFGDLKALKSLSIHDFRLAYSEYYLNLTLLQNFQQLNLTAFRKILKKHDKMLDTTRGAKWRQEIVLSSEIATNKAVEELVSDVEKTCTDRIEGGDHKRAMKRLRVPPLGQPHHSHWTVFRIGLWCGLLALFFIAISALIPWASCKVEDRGCWHNKESPIDETDLLAQNEPLFWEITIRLYRGIFLFALMIFLLGVNVHGWRASGVNHVLIFELDPRDHLSSLHLIEAGIALLVFCSASLTVWLLQFYLAYVFEINHNIIRYSSFAFIVLLFIFLINPIPIFMYTSRIWLLRVLWRIFTAPFHPVRFADFWLADQFTSLVPVFQDFVFIICTCSLQFQPFQVNAVCDKTLLPLINVISCVPAWFRFAQCLRRFRDTGKRHPHLTNAGKYSTTFLVILFRSLHAAWEDQHYIPDEAVISTNGTTLSTPLPSFNVTSPTTGDDSVNYSAENPFLYCWIFAATISTIYTYTWDVKMDWGLFDPNAGENKFLREQIVFRYKWYYYLAIVLDLILRLSWTLTVADIKIHGQTYITVIFITSLTFVEMFRRFVWNFFRLENEHVNNVGEFRAVRDISIKPILNEDIKAVERMMAEEDGANVVRHERRASLPGYDSTTRSNKFGGLSNAFTLTSNAAGPLFRKFKSFVYNQEAQESSIDRLDTMNIQESDNNSDNRLNAGTDEIVINVPRQRESFAPRLHRQQSAQAHETFRRSVTQSVNPLVDGDSDDD